VPQLAIDGTWRDSLLGLDYHLLTDATYFYRKESLKGFRFHLLPEVSLPWNYNSFYMTPAVAVFHSRYNLEDRPAALPDDPDVTTPIYSFDTGLALERSTGSGQQWLITLEPRLLYVNIPFEEQDDIPVFDTIEPDLNLVQLFRRNRFVGYDRIGDTNQLSVGLTARLLSATGGVRQLTGTIGQIRYYGSRDVTLPGEIPIDENSSDYIAELGIDLYRNWNVDLGYQWNTDQRVTTLAEARLQYRPGETSVVNLAYRYRRQELEQGDVSFSVPVGQSWNFVGRYNYSLQDNEPLDQFLGIEYETCCWRFRVIARKDVRRNTGEQDSSIAVQLELKNFTSLGNSADSLLERGILGYGYGYE
jgi:LPS-assembly protein